jgi:hypothetical protein
MRKVRGSSPVRDKDFRVRMRRPKYLGLVTLTSFGWDDKPRSCSLCAKVTRLWKHTETSMHSVSCLMRCKNSQDWLLATNNPDPDPDPNSCRQSKHKVEIQRTQKRTHKAKQLILISSTGACISKCLSCLSKLFFVYSYSTKTSWSKSNKRLVTLSLEAGLSMTYLTEPWMFSVQLLSQVTRLSWRTSFHLWPFGGSGILESLQTAKQNVKTFFPLFASKIKTGQLLN